MTATVVFLQGGGDGAYDEDALLAASLRKHLAGDAEVDYPRMPDEGGSDLGDWGPTIVEAIERAGQPLVLVAHSFGGYELLRHLAGGPAVPALALCLIAVPFPGGDEDWTFEGFTLPAGFGERLPPTFLYASEDDEIVPFAHRDLYAAAIPGSVIRTTTGGHQLGNDLRVVADDIREALRRG